MTTSRKTFAFLLSLIGLLPAASALAANLSLVVTPSLPSVADALYPGAGSTVTSATDQQTGLAITMAGRNYGVNQAAGQARWGIRNGPNPGNQGGSAFIVTNGFTPAAAGSKSTSTGAAASYISFTVSNVLPNTLFQNLSIDFSGLNFTRTTNAWAAASVGGYTNWTAATQTSEGAAGRRLSVTIPAFTWTGGEPLEIRLYGVTGTDEGGFASVKIDGTVLLAPQVPEPSSALLGLVAIAWMSRRRRK